MKTAGLPHNLCGADRYRNDLPCFCFGNNAFNITGNLNILGLCAGAGGLGDIVRESSADRTDSQIYAGAYAFVNGRQSCFIKIGILIIKAAVF